MVCIAIRIKSLVLIMAALAVSCSLSGTSTLDSAAAGDIPSADRGQDSVFSDFVRRRGGKLYEGDREFRFISFNMPELVMREEPYWGINHPFEQRNALQTIKQFGGRVTRSYVMSVKNEKPGPRHIEGVRRYNELVFQAMDNLLAEANRTGVRLIIPFLDNWWWWGGIKEFAALRGKSEQQFYTDPQLRADFKHLIEYVLNRRNTITGVLYKNDPAVLAWETGNELRTAPAAWTLEMAAYIKSIDGNHLVLDGNDHYLLDEVIDSPHIDIVNRHYYSSTNFDGIEDYEARFHADFDKVAGRKPLLIGEFGFAPVEEIQRLSQAIIDRGGLGALIWSLRQHDIHGGFRWHCEVPPPTCAYHWPGFAAGDAYQEKELLAVYHRAALAIQGLKTSTPVALDRPQLLPIETVYDIRWLGAVGATGYDVERSVDGRDWQLLAENVSDSVNGFGRVVRKDLLDPVSEKVQKNQRHHVFFQDLEAQVGNRYLYRVRARNNHGVSAWSGPRALEVTKTDGFETLEYSIGSASKSPETIRLRSAANSLLIVVESSVAGKGAAPNSYTIEVSGDGKLFAPVVPEIHQPEAEGGRITHLYFETLKPESRFIRISRHHSALKTKAVHYGFGAYSVWYPPP